MLLDPLTLLLPMSVQCYRTNDEHPTFQSLSSDDFDKKYCDLDPHTCTREDLRDFTERAVEMGVGYLGVCCGAGAVPCFPSICNVAAVCDS